MRRGNMCMFDAPVETHTKRILMDIAYPTMKRKRTGWIW